MRALAPSPTRWTVDGAVRVVNAAGEATSTGELKIKPYPQYLYRITGVSDTVVGPGGILTLELLRPEDTAGGSYPTIGDRDMDSLITISSEPKMRVYQIPLDTAEGVHFIGIPNKLKDEDKPAGLEGEDVWVTKYYEQPVEVTTVGMQPPLTTGFDPYTIYGSPVSYWQCSTVLDYADYDTPMAVFANGHFIKYFQPGDYTPEMIEEAGGLPTNFNNPPEVFELGEHSLMVASAEGYSIAEPGYRVAALDEIEIRVDSISPLTAKIGDVVTLTGKNLHWEGAGSYGLEPLTIRVGGKPVMLIPVSNHGETLDETRFIVTDALQTGAVEVDIHEPGGNRGEVERTLATGLTLTVDRGILDSFARRNIADGTVPFEVESAISSNIQTDVSDTGDVYAAWREYVDYDHEYQRLGVLGAGGFTDLGRIDQAPDVFPGSNGEPGPLMWPGRVDTTLTGDVYIRYEVDDIRGAADYYVEQRLTIWDGTTATVHGLTTYNSETGEGSKQGLWGRSSAPDENGDFWMLFNFGLYRCGASGWELVGDPRPDMTHVDPVYGEKSIGGTAPMRVDSSGALKQFGRVNYMANGEGHEAGDRMATYFLTRNAAGVWEQRQILGDMEWEAAFAYDREGLARVFTNDDEWIYILREEDDFVREEWALIPFPVGMVKPAQKEYYGAAQTGFDLEVGYDHANRAVGAVKARFAPDWEVVREYTLDSGLVRMVILLREDGAGIVQAWPVTVYAQSLGDFSKTSLEGVSTGLLCDEFIQISPAGTYLILGGSPAVYHFDGSRNSEERLGVSAYVLSL